MAGEAKPMATAAAVAAKNRYTRNISPSPRQFAVNIVEISALCGQEIPGPGGAVGRERCRGQRKPAPPAPRGAAEDAVRHLGPQPLHQRLPDGGGDGPVSGLPADGR